MRLWPVIPYWFVPRRFGGGCGIVCGCSCSRVCSCGCSCCGCGCVVCGCSCCGCGCSVCWEDMAIRNIGSNLGIWQRPIWNVRVVRGFPVLRFVLGKRSNLGNWFELRGFIGNCDLGGGGVRLRIVG